MNKRIFLSPPHIEGRELDFVRLAFESNYIAPLGPMVDAFEKEFADVTGIPYCLAVSSGTAAMHLAIRYLRDKVAGDRERSGDGRKPMIIASTLTFIGSVSPATFEDCDLMFIDCDLESWNMDPVLLDMAIKSQLADGRHILCVIPTDLYGQSCDLPRIIKICNNYKIPVISDSAEAMGARYSVEIITREPAGSDSVVSSSPESSMMRHAGFDAWASVYSFNGNKIITTSGGGMLSSHDRALIDQARKLSQQAREAVPWYEHLQIGFNYRMSNILAAVGRGQLQLLEDRVTRRRRIFCLYRDLLADIPGVSFMPEPDWSRSNRWLTVIILDPDRFGASHQNVMEALEQENIESRLMWKPMHLQPVFKHCAVQGGGLSDHLFRHGLCLPSGSALSDDDVIRIAGIIRKQSKDT
ncbi:DegT/DnrJ/EryC1/StrS family aminotransferase [bacterium]|nr:DegT/DnrJ/EryC1/StrS family aminotransferase [candidate division CSSED10-310 bacterium]